MKLTKRNITNKGFTLVELLVVISIIAALAAIATPVIMQQKKKADMITAVSNAKQIFLLMILFDEDFNSFPNENTAANDDDFSGLSSSTSNGLFAQFIAAGYTTSEKIFFAKGGSQTKGKPDDNISSNSDILKKGECGFAYTVGLSSSDNGGIPLVYAPMPKTKKIFNPDPYGGKGVVLTLDGSANAIRLNKSNKVKLSSGKTLFNTDVWTNAKTNNENIKIILPE